MAQKVILLKFITLQLTGTFSDGKPVGNSPAADVIVVVGGAEGQVVDGPIDEWANAKFSYR